MHTNQKLSITSTSLEQSLALGEKIGRLIRPGQLIQLAGDLGGGKTTLTKGIARGLGVTQTVTSPTFNIQRSYALPDGGTLEHFDLYRLEGEDAVEAELVEFLDDPTAIVVVEWAKPFVSRHKPDYLLAEVRWLSDTERSISITAHGPSSQKVLEGLA